MSTQDDNLKNTANPESAKTGSDVDNKQSIVSGRRVFHPEDYQKIAGQFDIDVEDAQHIVALLAGCFDENGRFKRDAFGLYIPEFSHYERKIFELLWDCFKNTLDPHDRTAFLNSMQLLIVQLKQPKKALKVLLKDFYTNTDEVNNSDRDALMLSNLLVRKYNKELHTDIEETPEEVLLVKNGLDRDVTQYAQWRIENDGENFLKKISTIREKIGTAVDPGFSQTDALPVDFLFSLEREVHIFLALVEGEAAYRIIREAIEVYGSPDGQIYQSAKGSRYLSILLQHLKVLIRGIGRVGGSKDITILEKIKQHADAFMQFREDPEFHGLVRQMLQWVDISMGRAAETP